MKPIIERNIHTHLKKYVCILKHSYVEFRFRSLGQMFKFWIQRCHSSLNNDPNLTVLMKELQRHQPGLWESGAQNWLCASTSTPSLECHHGALRKAIANPRVDLHP